MNEFRQLDKSFDDFVYEFEKLKDEFLEIINERDDLLLEIKDLKEKQND